MHAGKLACLSNNWTRQPHIHLHGTHTLGMLSAATAAAPLIRTARLSIASGDASPEGAAARTDTPARRDCARDGGRGAGALACTTPADAAVWEARRDIVLAMMVRITTCLAMETSDSTMCGGAERGEEEGSLSIVLHGKSVQSIASYRNTARCSHASGDRAHPAPWRCMGNSTRACHTSPACWHSHASHAKGAVPCSTAHGSAAKRCRSCHCHGAQHAFTRHLLACRKP